MPDPLPPPEGLIFDLDGTLVDTVPARIAGWVEALEAAGVPLAREAIGPMIGMDGKRLARLAGEAAGRSLSEEELETIDRAAGAAFDRHNTEPRPVEGWPRLREALRELELSWVIATSSRAEQVRASVAALELEPPPTIVDGSQVKRAKPAPDLLLLAAERLGVTAARCWVIGDSTWDMRAAVAAEMPSVAVLAGSAVRREALVEAGATAVMADLAELADTLRTSLGAR